jgi:hypothetical protein
VKNSGSEKSQSLIQAPVSMQSEPHHDVAAEGTKEVVPLFQSHISENTEPAGPKLNVSHPRVEASSSKRQPLAERPDRSIIAKHEAAYFPVEKPVHTASIQTTQPSPPPRESRNPSIDMKAPKPAPESPVEVKIGRVEIHFDAPAAPAASPASARPGGFSEYAELRRYVSRKR